MRWTSDKVKKMLDLWHGHTNTKGIADTLSTIHEPVTRQDVIRKLLDLGEYNRPDPLHEPLKHQLQARFHLLLSEVNEVMNQEPRLHVILTREGFLVAAATSENDARRRFR